MPLRNFDGETFVAFVDISGFKELMKTEEKALKAIDVMYGNGYRLLQENQDIQGLFISDCGILISDNMESQINGLKSLLNVIKLLNRAMIQEDFMLTSSISFGRFKYEERIEFERIGKTPIYGNAYVSAFIDNENGTPKLQPGECRIIKRNLPDQVSDSLRAAEEGEFRFMRNKENHFYYYWNVQIPEEIDHFLQQYKDTYNLKFHGMIKALRQQ